MLLHVCQCVDKVMSRSALLIAALLGFETLARCFVIAEFERYVRIDVDEE